MVWGFKDKEDGRKKKEKELINDFNELKATFEEQLRMMQKDRETADTMIIPFVEELMGDDSDTNYGGHIAGIRKKLKNSRLGGTIVGGDIKRTLDLIDDVYKNQTRYYEQLEKYIEGLSHLMISSFAIIDKKDDDNNKLRDYLDDRQKVKDKRTPQQNKDLIIKLLTEGKTQTQIARELNLNQSWISQIKNRYFDESTNIIKEETNITDSLPPIKKNYRKTEEKPELTQNQPSENTLKTKEEDETSEKR